jgi:2-polyprenyl-6-methoxyphenol hydroxylase-like FAD-dependent oxidoreductase
MLLISFHACEENMANVVMIGAGPVGLWTALQIKKRNPHWDIVVYERHEQYQRSHILRLDHWSLLLYGRNTKDEREHQFYNEITGKQLSQIMTSVADSVYIRTNDLEAALKSYAKDKGIRIEYLQVATPEQVMQAHPECHMFIAADGAHSKMRAMLLGEKALDEYILQSIVEVKYKVKGLAVKSNLLDANQNTNHMVFEYVGKEKAGFSPVTLRFFLDENTYKMLPEASFKNPLNIDSPALPSSLKEDIQKYIGLRNQAGDGSFCYDSGYLTKLNLSLYCARKFAIEVEGKAWFLVGDAALGVPYFRALNSGLILGSRLAQIVTSEDWPIGSGIKGKIAFYNFHRPLHITTEFTIARGKDMALKGFNMFRKLKLPMMLNFPFLTKKNLTDNEILEHYNKGIDYSCHKENEEI